MKVSNILVGPLCTNCYLLEKKGKVIIVDPGDDASFIERSVQKRKVVAIFITHYHFDHIGALQALSSLYDVPIFDYHKKGDSYVISDFSFEIIDTKGHSKDSVTFYFEKEKMMFCGDFIFQNSIGRCDLEGGSEKEMRESIAKIKKYPDVTLFPGHGNSTTLETEKKNNIFFRN